MKFQNNTYKGKFYNYFVKLSYSVPDAILSLISRIIFKGGVPSSPKNILINRVGNLGDTLTIINPLYNIRVKYPNSKIILLTSSGGSGLISAAEVLNGSDLVDEFLVYNNRDISKISSIINFFNEVRALDTDLWIELPNDRATFKTLLRNLIFSKFVGSSFSIGWKIGTTWMLKKYQAENIFFSTETKRIEKILLNNGIEQKFTIPRKQLVTKENSLKTLAKFKLFGDYIIISPSGKRRGTNLWQSDKFSIVAQEFYPEYKIIFVGAKGDEDIVDEIIRLLPFNPISLVGETSISELFAIILNAKLCICVDSGVQHMAAILGVKSISLFSAWQYNGKWFPDGENSIVIREDVGCKTCLLDVCNNDNKCMSRIDTKKVIYKAKESLRIL